MTKSINEMNSIISKYSRVNSQIERDIETLISKKVALQLEARFKQYDEICKNFKPFLNFEVLQDAFNSKADNYQLKTLDESKVSKQEFKTLKLMCDNIYLKLKNLCTLQTELA